ncbi:MAG: ATP-binding cassette domain-containing protein [Saprospiraceae bacterium]|nr:ATP-binding cassette domain-containing protein [Saprospiraceae bacterium]
MVNNKDVFSNLKLLLKLEKNEITAIYFYAISSGLIQLSLPLGIQSIIGFIIGNTMVASIYVLIFLIVLGVLIVGLLHINQMKIIEKIQQKIFVRYALDFTEKIPNIDLKEIDAYYLPEKINRFFETISLQKGFSKLLLDIPVSTIQILFGLILLSFYHPLFIAFSLLIMLILFVIFKISGKSGLETNNLESNYKYEVVGWLEEMGRVIKSIKYSQGSNLNLIKIDNNLKNYVEARTNHFKVLLFQYKSLVFFKVSITSLMLILGTYLLFDQKINMGQFVAAEIVIIAIINSLEKLIISLENVYDVITGLIKLDSILEIPNEKDGKIPFEADELKINIQNLSFAYNNESEVFKNLSLTIPSKSITCITGAENSGKSTLLKLLTSNYKNFKGTITFNDIPIQNLSLKSLREKTGIFLNDQDIFKGTLWENITLGKSYISSNDIMNLAKKMKIESFILQFNDSFETLLDPIGKKLPSSLINKILLLRTFIHDPILLILEDPWNSLDEISKKHLQQYLLDISKNKTIIISTNDSEFIKESSLFINLNKL